jgi:hypothetical protein
MQDLVQHHLSYSLHSVAYAPSSPAVRLAIRYASLNWCKLSKLANSGSFDNLCILAA